MSAPRRHFGKYRGTVTGNVDPLQQGRVQVSVPRLLGEGTLAWALPCVPYAGSGVGLFAVPPVGASAWVEFEGGDLDRPILAGCFWAAGEVPATPAVAEVKLWKTDGVSLQLSDLPGAGGLVVEVGPPAVPVAMKVSCTAAGIELSIGASTIVLSAASVSINGGALEVV